LVRRDSRNAYPAGVVDDSGRTSAIADHHRQAVAHRLEGDVAARLPEAREDEDVGVPVQLVDLGSRQPSSESHPRRHAELARKPLARVPVRAVADNIEEHREIT